MALWEGLWLDLCLPPFWVCHCSRSAVSGTAGSSASSSLAASKGEVSWLERLSTPSNSPASPLDPYQHDPDKGDERGRLSFLQCCCSGDVQLWVTPAPCPCGTLSPGIVACSKEEIHEKPSYHCHPSLPSSTALPLPGKSKQSPRSPQCPGSRSPCSDDG